MKGCKHNAQRTIEYASQTDNGHPSFQSGDDIILRCPMGCNDLHILVKGRDE
jgi:hypothetical protein